jgi:hypothetical protein
VERFAVLLLAILVLVAGVWAFGGTLGCERACGSSGEQAAVLALSAATIGGGTFAIALAGRGRLAASFLASIFGLVWFVVALGQAASNLR